MINYKELNLFLKYNNIEKRRPNYYLMQERNIIDRNREVVKKEVISLIVNEEIKKKGGL